MATVRYKTWLDAILSRWDPRPVSWIGGAGLAAIVLLMVLKPF